MDKKKMDRRAYALEAALGAVLRGIASSDATSSTLEPAEVLAYAKFVLGKRSPAKKKRRRSRPDATGHLNTEDGRAYWAPAGEPLPDTYPPGEPWKPVGFLTEDGLKEDLTLTVSDLFRRPPAATVPGPPTVAGATLEKFAEKVRDGDLAADPVPVTLENGIDLREVRTRLDSTEADEQSPPSSPVGEDPGDRGILTQWAEAIRQQDAAREAAREARDLEVDPEAKVEEERFATSRAVTWAPQRHEPETSEKAPDHVVTQGASLGCPECSAELKRREKRDEALERGRIKLGNRLPAGEFARTGPLDADELLAVAGSELYPPYDEEPSRELKIRNRKGEVWKWAEDASGWTSTPGDPWRLHCQWASGEMFRLGPWHVV